MVNAVDARTVAEDIPVRIAPIMHVAEFDSLD